MANSPRRSRHFYTLDTKSGAVLAWRWKRYAKAWRDLAPAFRSILPANDPIVRAALYGGTALEAAATTPQFIEAKAAHIASLLSSPF